MASRFSVALVLLFSAQCASAAGIQDYLFRALDAADGKSFGPVSGSVAEKFSQQTGSSEPIMVSVSTLKRFKQHGCARLAVLLAQDKVPTKEGQPIPFAVRYEMNLCRDGSAPAEGIDMSTPFHKGGA